MTDSNAERRSLESDLLQDFEFNVADDQVKYGDLLYVEINYRQQLVGYLTWEPQKRQYNLEIIEEGFYPQCRSVPADALVSALNFARKLLAFQEQQGAAVEDATLMKKT